MRDIATTDEAGDEWIKQTNKYDKLEHLKKNCTAEFLQDVLLPEMMQYLYEYQFNEIFNRLRKNHGIKTP
jgi:hypothetical protein